MGSNQFPLTQSMSNQVQSSVLTPTFLDGRGWEKAGFSSQLSSDMLQARSDP